MSGRWLRRLNRYHSNLQNQAVADHYQYEADFIYDQRMSITSMVALFSQNYEKFIRQEIILRDCIKIEKNHT